MRYAMGEDASRGPPRARARTPRARALSHSNYILYSESMPVGPEVRTRRIQLCINNLFIQYNVAALHAVRCRSARWRRSPSLTLQ